MKRKKASVDRASEDAAAYGRRAKRRKVKASKPKYQPIVVPEDVQWMITDADEDGKALIKLADFLHERGLRTESGSCASAIRAITELSDEVARLKRELLQSK